MFICRQNLKGLVAPCLHNNVMNLLPRNFLKSNLSLRVCTTDFNVVLGNLFMKFGFRDFVIEISNPILTSNSTFLLTPEFSPS